MKTIRNSVIFVLTCLAFQAYTQPSSVKPLAIGDTIPDLHVSNLISEQGEDLQLADLYQGGMLLIDFWATWCVPCIAEMPKLNALREKYGDRLNVLSITYQDSAEVRDFFETRGSDLARDRLIIGTNDTMLIKYLPHRFLPHYVWVDREGVIRATTGKAELTEEHIDEVLAEKPAADLRIKQDNMTFNSHDPFHLGDSVYSYRSIITPHIDGLNSGSLLWSNPGRDTLQTLENKRTTMRFFAYNNTIPLLFNAAYNAKYFNFDLSFRPWLHELNVTDSLPYYGPLYCKSASLQYDSQEAWAVEHTYSYDLTLPRAVPQSEFGDYMLQDLQRAFKLKARIEKRNISVIALMFSGDYRTRFAPAKDTTSYTTLRFVDFKLIGNNITMADILKKLNNWFDKSLQKPIIDKTGIPDDLAFDMEIDMTAFKEDIIKRGLSFEYFKKVFEDGLGFHFEEISAYFPILVLEE